MAWWSAWTASRCVHAPDVHGLGRPPVWFEERCSEVPSPVERSDSTAECPSTKSGASDGPVEYPAGAGTQAMTVPAERAARAAQPAFGTPGQGPDVTWPGRKKVRRESANPIRWSWNMIPAPSSRIAHATTAL